jgi:hypothetical protein
MTVIFIMIPLYWRAVDEKVTESDAKGLQEDILI